MTVHSSRLLPTSGARRLGECPPQQKPSDPNRSPTPTEANQGNPNRSPRNPTEEKQNELQNELLNEKQISPVDVQAFDEVGLVGNDRWAAAETFKYRRDALLRETSWSKVVFYLAQGLKTIPALVNRPAKELRPLLVAWYAGIPDEICDFADCILRFEAAWARVKHPCKRRDPEELRDFLRAVIAGDPSPEVVRIADANGYGRSRRLLQVLAMAFALAQQSDKGVFFLSVRLVAEVIGIKDINCVSGWLRILREDGVLEVAEEHTQQRATRYRFGARSDQPRRASSSPPKRSTSKREARKAAGAPAVPMDPGLVDHYRSHYMPTIVEGWHEYSTEEQDRLICERYSEVHRKANRSKRRC